MLLCLGKNKHLILGMLKITHVHCKSLFSKVIAELQSLFGQSLSKATKSLPFLLNIKTPLLPPESCANPPGVCAFIISGLFKSVTRFKGKVCMQFPKLVVSVQFINKQKVAKTTRFQFL